MGKHNQQRRKSLVLFKHGPLHVARVLFVVLFVLVTAATAATLAPQKQANAAESSYLNFQARLQTAAGAVVPDGNYHIEFKLYNAASSGTSSQGSCSGDSNCLWVETRSTGNLVTVKNGYLSVNLGSVNALPDIDWSQQLWLTMRVGGSGTSASWDGEMSPRLPLTALPYSFYAKQAGDANTLDGLDSTAFAAASGSNNYIQNTTSPQTANAYLQSANNGDATLTLKMKSGQTAGALRVLDSNGDSLAAIDNSGGIFAQQIASNDTISAVTYGGSHNVITATQNAANATVPVMVLQGGATPGSGADLLQMKNSSGQVLSGFNNAGQLYLGRASGATGSLKLFNSTNSNTVTIQSGTTSTGYTLTLPTALGSTNDCLKDGGSGALVFSACASAGGVTTIGSFSNTSIANGGSISGSTITFGAADATNPGMVSTGSQTFAGDKTFNGSVTSAGQVQGATLNSTGDTTVGGNLNVSGSGASYILGSLTIGSGSTGNAITNGSFETNTTGWNVHNGSQARVTTNALIGSASDEFTTSATSNAGILWGTNISVTAGKSYTFSAYIKGTSIASSASINAQVDWLGAGSSYISTMTGSTVSLSNGWQRVTVSGTAPVGAQSGTAYLYTISNTSGDKFAVDGVQFEQGGAATPYTNSTTRAAGSLTTIGDLAVGGNINTSGAYYANGTAGASIACSGGQLLQNAVTVGGIVTGGSCTSVTGGVTTVGTFSGTSIANGASISGNTITLGVADGTNPGMVSTTTQTFAGDKTFSGSTTVSNTGTSALKVQNSGGTVTALTADTSNGYVGIGTASPSRTLDVAVSNTQTASPMALFEQAGTGDAGIELKNANTSWYTGIDTSNGDAFSLNSNAAASGSVNTTLGQDYSSASPNSTDINAGSMGATKFTAGATGTVSSLSVAFSATLNPGTSKFSAAIYSDNGSGTAPVNLLGKYTGTVNVVTPNSGGINWNSVTLDSPVSVTSGTVYWLAIAFNDDSPYKVRTTGGTSAYRGGITAGTWGSTWNSNGNTNLGTSTYEQGIYGSIVTLGTLTDTYASSLLTIGTTGVTTFHNYADSTSAFQVQNASSVNIFSVDTSNAQVVLGTASSKTGKLVFNNSSNANTVTIQSGTTSSSYSLTLPTAAGTTGQCLAAGTVSGSNVPLAFTSCGSGGVTTVGTFSGSSQTNGASISGSTITFGPASATGVGMVTTGSQTFAGDKTFNGSLIMAAGATTFTQTYNSTAAGTAYTINLTNGSGTNTNGLLINRNAASGTTTNGINVTNTAGTLTNGLAFTGTIGTDINRGTGTLSLNGASGIILQNAGSTIATVSSTGLSVTGVVNASTNLQTGGTTRIDNTGALTNVTGSTAILTSGTLGLARGGTNNTTYTTNGVIYSDGTKLTSTGAGTTGQCLVATTSAAPSWGTCSSTSGVTTVGSFSNTSIANGASISGSTITFGAADGTNPGMVSTGTQSFAGDKTFTGQVKANNSVAGDFSLLGINGSATGLGIYGYANSNNGTNDVLRLDGSGGTVLSVKTNGTTTVKGGSILLQDSAGTTSFFSATSSGTTLQNSSGVDMFNLDVTTGHLKIYEAGGSHRYADIYYDTANNEAVFAASSGNTRVGSGSGNITLQLTNAADVLTFSKTVTLGSAYSANDFTITRNLTSGANSETGSVLKVESTGSASGTVSPNILLLNQANASATGYLINAQTGGAAKFQVSTAGTITMASGQSINGAGALTVASASGTGLTLSGPSGITLQSSSGNVQVGSATSDSTATQLVLDSYNQSTDPSGSNGAMYYNSSLGKFRCRENGAWTNCITALPVSVVLSADRTNSTTSAADVTDLSFSLAANTKYYYKFVIVYQATGATTTGIGFGVTTTQTPVQSQWCTNTSPNNTSGTATGASYCGTGDASATSAGVGVISTNFEQEFDGYIQGNASNASTLQLRFKSEIAASAVVVKAGSYGILTPVQ